MHHDNRATNPYYKPVQSERLKSLLKDPPKKHSLVAAKVVNPPISMFSQAEGGKPAVANHCKREASPEKWVAPQDFKTLTRPREKLSCREKDPGLSSTTAMHDALYYQDNDY